MSRCHSIRFISAVCSVASISTAFAEPQPDDRATGHVDSQGADVEFEGMVVGAAQDFDLPGLADGIIVQLGTSNVAATGGRVYVPLIDQKTVALDLTPISVRAEGYELREQLADGTWRTINPGPENTYTGKVAGSPDAYVAASWLREGLIAHVVFPDGERHWIQPLSDFVAGAAEGLHVVYREGDTRCDGSCGMGEGPTLPPSSLGGVAGTCGGDVCVAKLAVDADFEYYTARGSSSHATQDRIHAIINVINHQYVREVAITHVITTVLVRTAEPDPYTSIISDTLLCELITEWTDNQSAVPRDLTKLFTGRDISGSTNGQAANFGQICDNTGFCTAGLDNGAYCYSQNDFSATFACQSDVAAHEIGHLWGAHHCTCPNSTMNTTIACVNTFGNSGGVTVSEIDAHADAVGCLTPLDEVPGNNTCVNAMILAGTGTYESSNVNATTDGGALNCGSLSGNVGGGRNDVYFRVTPIVNGSVSVDTCGSNFDTIMTVHTGCPATPANQVSCSDDCGGTPCGCCDSCVNFAGVSGTAYFVRVAGYAGATGSITLNVDGPFTPGNNACVNAIHLADDASIDGSLSLATNDGTASCGSSSTNPDVWYSFTAGECGGTLTVDACGTHDRLGTDSGMDTTISMHTGCPGNVANQRVCNDDANPVCPGAAGLNRDSRATVSLLPVEDVLVRVSHFSTALDDGFFFLNADFTPAVLPPLVQAIDNDEATCGSTYTGPTPALTDPTCSIPVTWTLLSGPAGMTINPTTGVVTWPSPEISAVPHFVNIRASNSGGFDNESWELSVFPAAAVILPVPNGSHDCGSAFSRQLSLIDEVCMEEAQWFVQTGPTGLTIDRDTGLVTWPNPTIAGSPHTITIRASTISGFDDESWALTINRLIPVVQDVLNSTVECTEPHIGPTPVLTNPSCMSPVGWSLDSGPIGMIIDERTGVVTWPRPVIDALNTIVIRATNSAGFDQEGWRLVVEQAPPEVVDIPNDSGVCGQEYSGPQGQVTEPACMEPVTWSLVSGPQRMTIDRDSGKVNWPSPTLEDSGIAAVIRAASDAGTDDEDWRIAVSPAPPLITPISDATIPEFVDYVGPIPTLSNATCTTPVSIWSLLAGPPDMTIDGNTGVVSWANPRRADSPAIVTIRGQNLEGFDNESWTLTVAPLVCDTACGDFDGSGAVDLFDFAAFAVCFAATEPSTECPLPLFACTDLNGSGTVNAGDYRDFQSRFGRPPSSSPPNCD